MEPDDPDDGEEDEIEIEIEPDDPDNWRDEAEDRETTDGERDDHEGVPTVDIEGPLDAGDAGSGS